MYTLYLDETGDWGYPNYDPTDPMLCLCGSIVLDEYHVKQLTPSLSSFKRKNLHRGSIVLHRHKVMGRQREFSILKTDKNMKAFIIETSKFISGLDITILVVSLDKNKQYETYGTQKVDEWLPENIYAMLFTFIVERFLAFLYEGNKGKGQIIAESRGRKEDNVIQHHYSTILQYGTQFYRNWQFQKAIPTAIEFRRKRDNIAGLQISDWIAPPLSKKAEYPDGSQDKYGEWELYRGKIWIGKKAPAPGQIGFKTFPSNMGRELLNMPLKSA
jgi:hypothetical protein